MSITGFSPSRRTALGLGTGAALAVALPLGGTAYASTPDGDDLLARLRALEERHSARLGVFAHDVRTGRSVAYRADERFPMCSVFKTLAVAAVLRDLDHDGTFLARRIRYTAADVERSGWSPRTELPENLANGMTVAELCDATLRYSDNTAANLLLRELGGPTAVTRFARSIGDRTTRLDRWEPELNSAEPWRETDTTTPRAIGRTYGRLLLGDVLPRRDRQRLTRWMLANTTSGERFRKGLPADWLLADKTGGGRYGGNNDAGVTWPPDGGPIVVTVLTTRFQEDAAPVNPLVADAAALVAAELG
ncbi:class A beta-lactamase [Streptomyces sp. NBC_00572]|uniref:class A beta-lactamase n=1 Tax=Streptomyces sp. NBC_00572 TaxID=2903664 RepID=UPI00224E8768|nr:class A beta-lactamase [Streptomyces sp. NBC_00572]MCX4986109.1 class A beta-lactamase [Streptomyces sp. NBC_00572]